MQSSAPWDSVTFHCAIRTRVSRIPELTDMQGEIDHVLCIHASRTKFLKPYHRDRQEQHAMTESMTPIFRPISLSCGCLLAHHSLNSTFALYISSLPNMSDFQPSPFQQRMHLRLSTLHCTEGGHHVEVLMGHGRGSMLGWHYPLLDEYFTVRWIHSSSNVLENQVAQRIIPIM